VIHFPVMRTSRPLPGLLATGNGEKHWAWVAHDAGERLERTPIVAKPYRARAADDSPQEPTS
jgi:hypothetical protein